MLRSCTAAVVISSWLALSPGGAAADSAAVDDAPTFATLDRQAGGTAVGASLAYTRFDDDGFIGAGSALRLDLYGHVVGPRGIGAYGIVPLSSVSGDTVDERGIGNVEGGVLYVEAREVATFVLRGGLTLPTASGEDGLGANLMGTFPRMTDFASIWPRTLWLRASASALLRRGMLVARIDAGVDTPVGTFDDGIFDPDPLVRLNLGGGLDGGPAAVLLELVNIAGVGDVDDVGVYEEDLSSTIALTGRLSAGRVQPMLSVGLPLDERFRSIFEVWVSVGVEGRL